MEPDGGIPTRDSLRVGKQSIPPIGDQPDHRHQDEGKARRAEISELAQALHITSPTATNTLKRMQRDGWVDRRRDESDQRIVRVYLTEKAQTLREEARASFRQLDHEMTSMLSESEHDTLRKSLLKVHRYLASANPSSPDTHASSQPCAPRTQENIR